MAKKSMIERDLKRRRMAKKFEARRARLQAIVRDQSKPAEERFEAAMKLAELPRNSSKTRIRNRCLVTGRPRAFYRKLKMSRVALRELGSDGKIPGLVKSSW
ncbi:30S ribosomal protein S14 [Amphiplicatus metriothermophilus]|uniref:Small ribosomal subunit protein uS14 n=1 Tax=Amphiplicatus metriothermophilus TaxID=1519374 RepID=A0A239PPQ1_9PROT|nr:30S ribosomal protein S14 [Amphiplicatus metriothermophilus]MBB5518557.1 small subunit ribosomal protein S14 [Amphiplicatus metriothermophilus]SNT72284.1 SSU ribosomal protein S14P [Amphiplicatus metriothermophilus]